MHHSYILGNKKMEIFDLGGLFISFVLNIFIDCKGICLAAYITRLCQDSHKTYQFFWQGKFQIIPA